MGLVLTYNGEEIRVGKLERMTRYSVFSDDGQTYLYGHIEIVLDTAPLQENAEGGA